MLPRALEQGLVEMVGFARSDVTGRTRKALKVLKSIWREISHGGLFKSFKRVKSPVGSPVIKMGF